MFMEKTLLLFGSTGMLGWYAKTYFTKKYRVVCPTREEYDCLKPNVQRLEAIVRKHSPFLILNCTNAYQESDLNQFMVHSYFPQLLDRLATAYSCEFIHISTNAVFSGENTHYLESSLPDSTEIYAISKFLGESIQHSVIRTSILGESDRSSHSFIEWLKRCEIVGGYSQEQWNGITCLSLVEYIDDIIQTQSYWIGVRHVASKEIVTKYELAEKIQWIYDLPFMLIQDHRPRPSRLLRSFGKESMDSLELQLLRQKIFKERFGKPSGNYMERTTCRFCNNSLETILDLGKGFGLAGGFLEGPVEFEQDKVYPLSLAKCTFCQTFQCCQVVSSDELFKKNYYYYSSMIPSLVQHFESLAEFIDQRYPKDIKLLEIGCNDGVLLHPLKQRGFSHLIGVDPSRTIQNVDSSISTYASYFNELLAKKIVETHGSMDVFVSCNSFAHMDDMKTIFKAIQLLLKSTGDAWIEVHDSKKLFEEKHFDFIYHEHMSYYTCTSMVRICEWFGLYLFEAETISNHGGSIRYGLSMEHKPIHPSVQRRLQEERFLWEPDYFKEYALELTQWKNQFRSLIHDLQGETRVYGYGASGRSNTLVQYCNLHLDGMIDDAPSKIGTYTPTFQVKIENSNILYSESPPTHVVLLAWTYADVILKTHQRYLDNGGTFIIPLPSIQIIYSKHLLV